MTVDRQMKRYHVPRLAFINKMDRTGADPLRVVGQVREKLAADASLMQLPIGAEEHFEGVIDLVSMKALYFDGEKGETVRTEDIPADQVEAATTARQEMLEALSMYSDELMELLLSEEDVPEELIHSVTKDAVQGSGHDAGVPWHRLPQQGRAAAARRDRALSAFAAGSRNQGQGVRQP